MLCWNSTQSVVQLLEEQLNRKKQQFSKSQLNYDNHNTFNNYKNTISKMIELKENKLKYK